MRNDKIGEMLKGYRKQLHLTVPEVAQILHDKYGIDTAEKTIYGWESNQAHPTTDTFLVLCEIYHITELYGFYESADAPTGLTLTEEEEELIHRFRTNPQFAPAVRQIFGLNSKRSKNYRSSK